MGQQEGPSAKASGSPCCSHVHVCGEQSSLLNEKEAAIHLIFSGNATTTIVSFPLERRFTLHRLRTYISDTPSLVSRHTLLRV